MPAVQATARPAAVTCARTYTHNLRYTSLSGAPEHSAALLADPFAGRACPACVGSGHARDRACGYCRGDGWVYPRARTR